MNTARLTLVGLAFAALITVVGCGAAPDHAADKKVPASPPARKGGDALFEMGGEQGGPAGGMQGGAKNPPKAEVERKIIFEGHVDVIVEQIDPTAERVQELVRRFEGYLAASEVTGTGGSRRTAEFTVRVPADKYEALREEFAKLGNTTRNASKSEDVTEEYMDLEARVKILKQEEEALKDLLKKDAGKLDELLKVREQLARNREQIERAEGRIRYLSAKVAYSTIRLTLRETKDYVPPTSPSFGGQIGSAFGNSVDALYTFGKNIVLFVVAVAPWLPLILLGLWLLRRGYRWAMSPARKAA